MKGILVSVLVYLVCITRKSTIRLMLSSVHNTIIENRIHLKNLKMMNASLRHCRICFPGLKLITA
ncbi:hypothetical protein Gohar_020877 [Gossypium harknessii]|uniref:Uncharacterized protein n=1 Tax=Gossypium harknessii TaxID=34285 RepID=A0A7J9I1S9_9ROSI|nr:hypothetical protein [Gossypium harknessii]